MSAGERWRQVDGIVEAALDVEAAERPAFVARACGDDADLRREVESLLACDRADDFLEVPAATEAARVAAAAAPDSLVGKSVGRFEVLERIGIGGMGEVYLARDARLQRRVAIKRLPQYLSGDAERVRRFRQEALATSALNHPNIVTVHEVLEHEGGDLLVTEHVEGVTLRERLSEGALPLAAVLDIGLQVARGLAAAHAIGIVHRDVKPENVMVRADGLVKVLDFGIAKSTRRALDVEESGTGAGSLIGTIAYMSPEQARGTAVDARSDVWSLAVMLYELATGETPFGGATPSDRLAAILQREPAPPSRVRGGLPADFDRLVARALAKDPAARPADGAQLAAQLEALAARASAQDAVATQMVTAAQERPAGRLPTRLVQGVALVVVALAVAWGLWRYRSNEAIDSLAVLPFETRSDDPDAEYLGDGLAESLIEQVSRLPSLRVMARATVFRYKGTADPVEAGRQLGVGAVLTGVVTRRGNQVLVSAELVQTSTGARLWGETYDRPFSDLMLVRDRIAADIAGRLRPRLTQEERRTLSRHGTDDPEAYDLFLKAGFWFAKNTEEGDLEARRLFEQAVQRDPRFIEPRLGIAITHSRAAVHGYAPPSSSWARVEEQSAKVLEIDPGNLPAWAQRVNRTWFFEWDFARADAEYRDLLGRPGITLGSRFSPALPASMYLWGRGRADEAVALAESALEGDPGNSEIRLMRADFLVHAGRLDPAVEQYRALIDAEPDDPSPWFGLAQVLRRKGDVPGAIEALRKAYALSGEPAGTQALAAARTESDYERAEIVVARSRLADVLALARERYVSPLSVARLHAQAGDAESAFAALETAFAERSPGLVLMKVDGAWDRIRADPRFAAVVRRVGIP